MIVKKLFALFTMYTYLPAFKWAYNKWFAEDFRGDFLIKKARIIRRKFWSTVGIILLLFIATLTVGFIIIGSLEKIYSMSFWLRITAVFMALTGSISRAVVPLGMWSEGGFHDELDKLRYVFSQVGATLVLIFVLLL